MSHWKDALCLLAVFAAYGLVGRLDYEDAIALEEAMRQGASRVCAPSRVASARPSRPPPSDVALVRRETPDPPPATERACWPTEP